MYSENPKTPESYKNKIKNVPQNQGNTIKSQEQLKYTDNEILDNLQEIINIEDSETRKQTIQVFINKRLSELLKNATKETNLLSLRKNEAEGLFIHPKNKIERIPICDGFKINDPEIYTILLKNLEKFYKNSKKQNLKQIVPNSIIYSLGEYFGNYYGTQEAEDKNKEFYLDHTTANSDTINLSELKGKEFAVCAEKASVAHNYLKFLGIDSHIIFSDNCKLGDSNDGHAYIILKTKKGRFIFDPTNPILIINNKGGLEGIKPASYKISEKDYNHLWQV